MKEVLRKLSLSGLVATAMLMPVVARAADAPAAAAAPSPVGVTMDVPVLSAYAWRGQVLNDEAVVQPTVTVTKGGFTFNWWANFNLTDNMTGDTYEFSEHDISVSYSHPCPITGANATLGVVNYDFPNQSIVDGVGSSALVKDTRELFLTYAFTDVLLQPTLSVYYDFKEADGFYGSFAIGQSKKLNDKLSVQGSASIGASSSDWNDYYYGVSDSTFNDWSVSLTLPYAACANLTVTPGVQYVSLIDSKIRDVADASPAYSGTADQFIGSLKLSYVF